MKKITDSTVNVSVSQIISIIFHPILFAPMAFALIFFSSLYKSSKGLECFVISIIATSLTPMIYVYLMKKHGRTKGLDVPEREKRKDPFIIGIVAYLIALLLFWILKAPKPALVLMWAYAFNTMVAILITHYWKISIHGMAAGGPTAALGYVISSNFYLLLLMLPLLVYSRVALKAHTPMQVIAGFALGFILTLTHFKILMPL
ncbi:MAG: hypothetical protein DRP89_01980 [Candidatus Neomarinimicrobiota bacterium]|nr:MAG: hypothetical protein DRP89_01980 [Candidatus Neomarinimicrobiota bacterium]